MCVPTAPVGTYHRQAMNGSINSCVIVRSAPMLGHIQTGHGPHLNWFTQWRASGCEWRGRYAMSFIPCSLLIDTTRILSLTPNFLASEDCYTPWTGLYVAVLPCCVSYRLHKETHPVCFHSAYPCSCLAGRAATRHKRAFKLMDDG